MKIKKNRQIIIKIKNKNIIQYYRKNNFKQL